MQLNEYMNIFCNIGQDHSLTFNRCLSKFDSFKLSGLFSLFTQVNDSGPYVLLLSRAFVINGRPWTCTVLI